MAGATRDVGQAPHTACVPFPREAIRMNRQHRYGVLLEWTGNLGAGTISYGGYSRDHVLRPREAADRWILGSLFSRRPCTSGGTPAGFALGVPPAVVPWPLRQRRDRGPWLGRRSRGADTRGARWRRPVRQGHPAPARHARGGVEPRGGEGDAPCRQPALASSPAPSTSPSSTSPSSSPRPEDAARTDGPDAVATPFAMTLDRSDRSTLSEQIQGAIGAAILEGRVRQARVCRPGEISPPASGSHGEPYGPPMSA